MAAKHKASFKSKQRSQDQGPSQKATSPIHESKDANLDAEIKSTAGTVQEELTPIRHAAGHSHTH